MSWQALATGASAVGSYLGQKSANKANKKLAKKQMKFQEKMSNTQYQRGMADMRQAGLNPILAYKQGGASSPSGQTATMQNSVAAGMDVFNKTTNSAIALKRQKKDLQILDDTSELLRAQKSKAGNEGLKAGYEANLLEKQDQIMDALLPQQIKAAETRSKYPWFKIIGDFARDLNPMAAPALQFIRKGK